MSYKIDKPYTEIQYEDFVVQYNHTQGLQIEESDIALYALEPNEQWNEQTQRPEINPEYEQEQFVKASKEKYAEITEKYDYANKYLVLKVDNELGLYANVSWYQTWTKVKSLVEQLMPQSETSNIPNAIRFYKITPKGKLYNKNIQNLSIAKFIQYYNILQYAQFNVLQPKRDTLYLQLTQSKTIKDIKSINVDFGITLNEQDMEDVNLKIDLNYTE